MFIDHLCFFFWEVLVKLASLCIHFIDFLLSFKNSLNILGINPQFCYVVKIGSISRLQWLNLFSTSVDWQVELSSYVVCYSDNQFLFRKLCSPTLLPKVILVTKSIIIKRSSLLTAKKTPKQTNKNYCHSEDPWGLRSSVLGWNNIPNKHTHFNYTTLIISSWITRIPW